MDGSLSVAVVLLAMQSVSVLSLIASEATESAKFKPSLFALYWGSDAFYLSANPANAARTVTTT
tara:strand:- start:1924 stop:2115 length:192 start_codon:yes stop_codon:yes gene_type:complete